MSEPYKHHIVQKAYQLLFANPADFSAGNARRLHYFNLRENHYLGLKSPKSQMMQPGANSSLNPDLTINNQLEKELQAYEGEYFPSLPEIAQRGGLCDDTRNKLTCYISLQMYRYPKTYEESELAMKDLAAAIEKGFDQTTCHCSFNQFMFLKHESWAGMDRTEY